MLGDKTKLLMNMIDINKTLYLMGNHHPEAYNPDNSHQMPFDKCHSYHHLPPNAM
jgi:hypothetical protein